jgi:predicted nucleic acid-binding Zn ribbon protein
MGGVRMGKTINEGLSEECRGTCRDILKSAHGLTHFELLEYLLLVIMVIGVVLVLGTSFSEVQAKIWAKLQNDLLSMN